MEKLKEQLKHFAESTTAHGLARIPTSRTKIVKFIWIIIILGCGITSFVFLYQSFAKYLAFKPKDVVSISREITVKFPSVTVCPLYPIATGKNFNIYDYLDNNSTYVYKLNQIISGFYEKFDEPEDPLYAKYIRHKNRVVAWQWIYENNPNITNASHSWPDLVPICSFKGKPCKAEHIEKFVDPNYYNCYTFNGMNSSTLNGENHTSTEDEMIVESIGPTSGLSLIMFLDLHEEQRSMFNPMIPTSGSAGIRVVIHETGTVPDPTANGFDIPPGFSTNVPLRLIQRNHMEEPWGTCDKKADPYLKGSRYTYSRSSCKRQCVQGLLKAKCGCISSLWPINNDADDSKYCGTFNIDEWIKQESNRSILEEDLLRLDCEEDLLSHLTEISEFIQSPDCQSNPDCHDCDCRPACEHYKYYQDISMSYWPMESAQMTFYESLMTMPGYNDSTIYKLLHKPHDDLGTADNSSQVNKDLIRKNFLRLNIYYKTIETEVISMYAEFTSGELVAEVGGTLGIFLGVSFVTLCEVVGLLSNLISSLLCNKNRKIKDTHDLSEKISKYDANDVKIVNQ
ncbi:unnamed protein product [Owenia fusiformis]|uniref:Uncharacterized protein n=1 Tax=Owenia fusiformis TaxID=6347 RepID=A0A8J1TU73_OWEFU|nr:unnamed protein product [Owenia fusiformis]